MGRVIAPGGLGAAMRADWRVAAAPDPGGVQHGPWTAGAAAEGATLPGACAIRTRAAGRSLAPAMAVALASLAIFLPPSVPRSGWGEDVGYEGKEGGGVEPQYRLQPGDIVRFWVYRMPEFSSEAMVTPSGHVSFPLAGQFVAKGRTIEELTADVKRALVERGKLAEPIVTLTVREVARQRVYILGAVTRPQEIVLPMDGPITVSQAVAAAGGFAPEARKDSIRIYRRGAGGRKDILQVDLEQALDRGALDKDVVLMPGDTVFVPRESGYFVLGKVIRPGFYSRHDLPLPSGRPITAGEAIALAGGFAEGASPGSVKIIRRGVEGGRETVVEADLESFAREGRPEKDVALTPGDTVVVPSGEGVFVLGQVKKPGAYSAPGGRPLTVTKAIAMAGGFDQYAKSSAVRVFRRDGADRALTVDVRRITSSGDLASDVELKAGDVVFVPEGVF